MSIIVYTKTGCPWCKEVVDLFNEKGVQYDERGIRNSKEFYDELVKKTGQDKTPTLDIDGEIIVNTDRDAVEVFLKNKGVPGF